MLLGPGSDVAVLIEAVGHWALSDGAEAAALSQSSLPRRDSHGARVVPFDTRMIMFEWLRTKLIQFFSARARDQQMKISRNQKESGSFRGDDARLRHGFESDYKSATDMLKMRMNNKFPDNFHAKLGSSNNNTYDYGVARAEAVDKVSTAVALALRDGATVRQAAEAGAASVGI